jgi:Na+-transporting NADH:ubiquinone oxidoreductase subunit B
MFYGMYNLGYQANEIYAVTGGSVDGWRGALIGLLGGYDAGSILAQPVLRRCISCRSTP